MRNFKKGNMLVENYIFLGVCVAHNITLKISRRRRDIENIETYIYRVFFLINKKKIYVHK